MLIFETAIAHDNERGKKASIFSVDVDSQSVRLATGSQDCTVKLWDIKEILAQQTVDTVEQDSTLLCTLTVHSGAVLCVRWNKSGLLASGSDDKSVIIWHKQDTQLYSKSLETWKPLKTLHGHRLGISDTSLRITGDVSDLAWSPDDCVLATASFDNTVILWDTENFDRIHCITCHQGFVKGLAFDPVGQYLASQSDDASVKIWRTSDWGLEASISQPYINAPPSTYFRRLSWSPCGSTIITANGENGMLACAPVIQRAGWTAEVAIYGHQNPIECSAFNPRLFKVDGKDTAICALGSQDCSVSVWWTAEARSIIATTSLYTQSVLDMCWSQDGYNLISCAFDGSVKIFQFSAADLGEPSAPDMSILTKSGLNRKRAFVAEGPYLNASAPTDMKMDVDVIELSSPLSLPIRPLDQSNKDQIGRLQALLTMHSPKSSKEISEKQRVTTTKDGKKRIQPVFLQQTGVAKTGESFALPVAPSGSSIKYTLPTIVVSDEKMQTLLVPELRKRIYISPLVTVAYDCLYQGDIVCMQGSDLSWRATLETPILLASLGTAFSAFATLSGQILIYSNMGIRIFPPLLLDSPTSFLEASGPFLMAISAIGTCYVWNVKIRSACISGLSVLAALRPKAKSAAILTITKVHLSESGAPKLYLSDSTVKLFDMRMNVWLHLEDAVTKNNTTASMLKDISIQRYTTAQLESHMMAAVLECNPKQYRKFWVMYLKKLCDEESKGKITEICDALVLEEPSEFDLLLERELGVSRRMMLDEIMGMVGCVASLQRIVELYRD